MLKYSKKNLQKCVTNSTLQTWHSLWSAWTINGNWEHLLWSLQFLLRPRKNPRCNAM